MNKSRCLISLHYLQCSDCSNIHPKPRTTTQQRTIQWTMYRIYKEVYIIFYIPLASLPLFAFRKLRYLFVFCLFHPSNCWLNQHEQMLAHFSSLLGYRITFCLGKKKKWHITLWWDTIQNCPYKKSRRSFPSSMINMFSLFLELGEFQLSSFLNEYS